MKPEIIYNNLFDGKRLVSAVPVGVCSRQIDIVLVGDTIEEILFTGGVPRQHTRSRRSLEGHEGGGCHRTTGGYRLRWQGHLLPRPAHTGIKTDL